MIRILIAITILTIALFFVSCKKNTPQDETILYGTWVKGSGAGDTLQFMRKNNRHILRYNVSFNAAMVAYTEMEYKYQGGKLSVRPFSPTIQDFYEINSFSWNEVGSEFKFHGIELFFFLSSTHVYFTYHKIR